MGFLGGGFFGSGASKSKTYDYSNRQSVSQGFQDIEGPVSAASLTLSRSDDARVDIRNTDYGAIAAALGFATDVGDDALDAIEAASMQSIEAVDRSGDRVLEATRGGVELADRAGQRTTALAGDAIDTVAEISAGSLGQALEYSADVRQLSAAESAAARQDALDYADEQTGRALEFGGQAFAGATDAYGEAFAGATDAYGRALDTVDDASDRNLSVVAAVLEDLAESRDVSAQQLATTEQALSKQSQRVTDIAATRLTGGVTDVIKYLSIAIALGAIGFGIAQRA